MAKVLWRGPDGLEIEAIRLDGRQRLRVSRVWDDHRTLVAYYSTIAQLAEHVDDFADLVEIIELPSATKRAARPSTRTGP
ncbi:hypothetical protein [Streptomyces albidoflavus]|uniref:hypothetical protein n=1 Tax=Streptomyces albidoflavus TaxID=1886 RepID=UPI00331AF331